MLGVFPVGVQALHPTIIDPCSLKKTKQKKHSSFTLLHFSQFYTSGVLVAKRLYHPL